MRKLLLVSLGVAVIAVPTIVMATPSPRVFVCKYVGTPGVNERLQTGQNPIRVSQNSIKDYKGVDSYFNDKHGRSYVLEVDNGQDEPNVSECPKPDKPTAPPNNPPTTPPVTPPATPPVVTPPSTPVDETNVEGQGK